MALLQGKKFLFLPNCKSSTLNFLSDVIRSNGGTVIHDVTELDKQMIILINKSFIDANRTLTNEELFLKEFELNPSIVWGFILHEKPICVEADCVSEWLKAGRITFAPQFNVLINQGDTSDSSGVVSKNVGESEEETTDQDVSVESQLDTDVGSQESEVDQRENQTLRTSSKKDAFSSPMSGTDTTSSPLPDEKIPKNDMLVRALGRLAKRYEIKGDQFRTKGYKLAKIGIEKYPEEILSGEQARRNIASVGPSIAKKIQIILDTGSLPGLNESFDLEKKLNYFTQCHDVGIYTAKRWNLLGLQSFVDVSKRFPDLFVRDWPILFGWSYYEDWLMKISREECEEILKVVKAALKEIDPDCHLELQGSYVRGAPECGDIDILFYKEGCNSTSELGKTMQRLALALYNDGYVKCFLQISAKVRQVFGHQIRERLQKCRLKCPPSPEEYPPAVGGLKKFFLGFQLKSEFRSSFLASSGDKIPKLEPEDSFMSLSSKEHPCRRVDFFCCRYSELGAARLQWTGPKEFNRWIRLQAMHRGMKLTQHGLFRDGDVLLESFDEKRIFALLDEEYVGPEERSRLIKKRQKQ